MTRPESDYQQKQAWGIVNYAIRTGKLQKPKTCHSCGGVVAKRSLVAHHEDYSKPLEVTWICRSCHFTLHVKEMEPRSKKGYLLYVANEASRKRFQEYLQRRKEQP